MKTIENIVIGRMWHACLNKGEEAVLTSIIHDLKKISKSVKIVVLSLYPHVIRQRHSVNAISGGFVNLWGMIQTIARADLFVWAGGNMLQDKSSLLDIPRTLIPVAIAAAFSKPVVLYGIDAGPISSFLGRFLVRKVVNQVDLITIRESYSARLLSSIGVTKPRLHVTADPAFTLTPSRDVNIDALFRKHHIIHGKPIFVFAVRKGLLREDTGGIIPMTLRRRLNLIPRSYRRDLSNYVDRLAATADKLYERFGAQILLIPMDVTPNNRDDLFCKAILERMKHKENARMLCDDFSPEELFAVLKKASIVIGGRLHALILAASVGVPIIGICYVGNGSGKITKFMKMIKQDRFCTDIYNIVDGNEDIFALVEEGFLKRDKIKRKMKLEIEILKNRASTNLHFLKKLLTDMRIPECNME